MARELPRGGGSTGPDESSHPRGISRGIVQHWIGLRYKGNGLKFRSVCNG
jgi:hypothetical protein